MISNKKLIFMVYSLSCVAAAVVCLIVNLATDQKITWAAYPLLSIAFGWALFLPLLAKKHKIILLLSALTLLTLPYLLLLSRITSVTGWFIPVGLPSAVIGIIAAWILVPLYLYTKMNILYKAAISLFVIGFIANTVINYYVDIYTGADPFMWSRFLSTFSCLIGSAVFGILGYTKPKKLVNH
ncbi:MAG: DUF6320 domain-containing protein [Oscillospiraceae bacterium]|nr:DUF6320 domain-containing protein [Oscillospiraceae bacterium]